MYKHIRNVRVPSRKPTGRLKLVALVCACLIHGIFLFGFRIASTPVGSWAARDVLLWITVPRKGNDDAASGIAQTLSLPFVPVLPEQEPRVSDRSALTRYFLSGVARTEIPLLLLTRRTGTGPDKEAEVRAPRTAAKKQWRVDNPKALDRIMNKNWRQMLNRETGIRRLPDKPVVLVVDAAVPSGIRQVTVIASSGSDAFDAEAVAFIRSLPFNHGQFITVPEEERQSELYRAFIGITVETVTTP
jgi:hypothetical protein